MKKKRTRRKRKKGERRELKVTNAREGSDSPLFSLSSDSGESDTTMADSGIHLGSPAPSGSGQLGTRVTASAPAIPTIPPSPSSSPAAKRIRGDSEEYDGPLSARSGLSCSETDEEMLSVSEGSGGETIPMDTDAPAGQPPATAPQSEEAAAPAPTTTAAPSAATTTTTAAPASTITTAAPAPTAPAPGPAITSTSSFGTGGTNPGPPGPSTPLATVVQARVLASPALAIAMAQFSRENPMQDINSNNNKPHKDYKGIIEGLNAVAKVMSTGFEEACVAVQETVNQALETATAHDRQFIKEASTSLIQWVRAVQPAMDCIGRPLHEHTQLLDSARQAGMRITRKILGFFTGEDDGEQTNPLSDIMVRAFAAARAPTDKAVASLHEQLPDLADQFIPPGQEGVFLSGAFSVIVLYYQEVNNMVLSQTVVPTQVVPGIWGARQGLLASVSLLAPQTCPVSWPAQLVERVNPEPEKQEEPARADAPAPVLGAEPSAKRPWPEQVVAPTCKQTPSKSEKSKTTSGSGGKRLNQRK